MGINSIGGHSTVHMLYPPIISVCARLTRYLAPSWAIYLPM
nr:MAG TPA: hypothetical protein [Caudoviricetes sp.]